jgi:hypothetical protein
VVQAPDKAWVVSRPDANLFTREGVTFTPAPRLKGRPNARRIRLSPLEPLEWDARLFGFPAPE